MLDIEYKWELRNKADKPNSNGGRTAQLHLLNGGGVSIGHFYVETWLYGCCLSGLSKIDAMNYMPGAAFPSLAKFLSTLSCRMNDPAHMHDKYISRRFMFTLAGAHTATASLKEELMKHAKLITKFENWCHSSAENQMYFLNLKDYQ